MCDCKSSCIAVRYKIIVIYVKSRNHRLCYKETSLFMVLHVWMILPLVHLTRILYNTKKILAWSGWTINGHLPSDKINANGFLGKWAWWRGLFPWLIHKKNCIIFLLSNELFSEISLQYYYTKYVVLSYSIDLVLNPSYFTTIRHPWNHLHIWQVSQQLNCGEICRIWTPYSIAKRWPLISH